MRHDLVAHKPSEKCSNAQGERLYRCKRVPLLDNVLHDACLQVPWLVRCHIARERGGLWVPLTVP